MQHNLNSRVNAQVIRYTVRLNWARTPYGHPAPQGLKPPGLTASSAPSANEKAGILHRGTLTAWDGHGRGLDRHHGSAEREQSESGELCVHVLVEIGEIENEDSRRALYCA